MKDCLHSIYFKIKNINIPHVYLPIIILILISIYCSDISKFICSISSGILVSSIFYFIVVYIPNQAKKNKTIDLLEEVLSTIPYTYAKNDTHVINGTETKILVVPSSISSINHYGLNCLFSANTKYIKNSYINELIGTMQAINEYPEHCVHYANKGLELEIEIFNGIKESMRSKNYGALKASHDTALARFSDFENCLTLANTLSADITEQWLIIIDKVRLMNRNYEDHFSKEQNLNVSSEKYSEFNFSAKDVYWFSTMIFGFLEYCEAVAEWNNLIKKDKFKYIKKA